METNVGEGSRDRKRKRVRVSDREDGVDVERTRVREGEEERQERRDYESLSLHDSLRLLSCDTVPRRCGRPRTSSSRSPSVTSIIIDIISIITQTTCRDESS